MEPDDDYPRILLYWALAIAIAALPVGWALTWVVKAICVGVGMATAIISGGLAVVMVSAPWVLPVGGSVLVAVGGTAVGVLVVKVYQGLKKDPLDWLFPLVAVASAFVLDSCKELYQPTGVSALERVVFGAATSLLYLCGGALWQQQKVRLRFPWLKIMAVIIFLTPPALIYMQYVQKAELVKNFPPYLIVSIFLLLALLLVVAYVTWALGKQEAEEA